MPSLFSRDFEAIQLTKYNIGKALMFTGGDIWPWEDDQPLRGIRLRDDDGVTYRGQTARFGDYIVKISADPDIFRVYPEDAFRTLYDYKGGL